MIAVSQWLESSRESSHESRQGDPLDWLAQTVVRLSDQRASTPVLVTPRYLSLRKPFFIELVRTLSQLSNRPIRVDWYRRVPSVISLGSDAAARLWLSGINRTIASIAPPDQPIGMMQITATISRPGGIFRDLVVGWCDDQLPLPAWATAIHLSCSDGTVRQGNS
jgi:hypothetical protein